MKYNININQRELVRISKKARLAHGAILDYIKSLCVAPSEKLERITHDSRIYTWMDYRHALREMPLLRGKTAASLTPIIQDLESWGLILTVRPDNQKVYVAPGLNFERVETETDTKAVKQSSLDNLTNNTTKENHIQIDAPSGASFPKEHYKAVSDHYIQEYQRLWGVSVAPAINFGAANKLLKTHFARGLTPKQVNLVITSFLKDLRYNENEIKPSPDLLVLLSAKHFNRHIAKIKLSTR